MSSNKEKLEELGNIIIPSADIFKAALIEVTNELVQDLSQSAQLSYPESPNDALAQSVKPDPPTVTATGISIGIRWLFYGNFQDKGVSGTEFIIDSPYRFTSKMPPISAWARYDVDDSTAFAISKKIFKEGFEGTRWASKIYEDPNRINELAIAAENYILTRWQSQL